MSMALLAAVAVTVVGGAPSSTAASSSPASGAAGAPAQAAPAPAVPERPAPPVPAARGAGTVVRVAPLADGLRLAGSGRSVRLWYRSTSWNGRSTVVTGTVDVPAGKPPRGGWPVVSYAHGATGVADTCAPSVTGHWVTEKVVLEALLADGYAIVATDYEGLGTPGPTFPSQGLSEAYNVIDIVRAARRIAPLSRSWVVAGHSMGGYAAFFTGATAAGYAPSLDHRGSIALAPVSQWRIQMSSPVSRDPYVPVDFNALYWATSASLRFPARFVPEQVFTPRGLELVELARTLCVPDLAPAVAGVTNGEVYRDPAASADLVADLMARDEVPITRYPRPVRIAQGVDDPLSALTAITVAQLTGAGNDVVYLPVEGADHLTLPTVALPQLRGWVGELFAVPPIRAAVVG